MKLAQIDRTEQWKEIQNLYSSQAENINLTHSEVFVDTPCITLGNYAYEKQCIKKLIDTRKGNEKCLPSESSKL